MPALTNPKHEHFSRLVAADIAIPAAYERAGFRPDPANACKLAKRPAIAERVGELQAEALKGEGIDVNQILAGVAAIAFNDPRSFFEWDQEGVRVRPGVSLSAEDVRCVAQVEQTTLRGEKTIRLRLCDRLRALETLGRWAGLDKPSAPDPEPHLHVHVESPREIIEARLARLHARRVGGPEIEGFANPLPPA